ncbi:glycoside hydrolase family 3 protein [Nonomuraea sp. NPDC050790]|uniref:glycoside hydrolase family 3 protein n=1 Tax=Nonomuraea sp. NPDC050790 TaxID=3364371 RepID=UPI0037B8AFBD
MNLHHLADACLLPGFAGHDAPDWVRARLAEGLGGVVLYHGNVRDRAQLTRLTAGLRAANPDVLIAIDEEGGDVTRLDLADGSPWPGSLALGVIDDTGLTAEVARHLGADLAAAGVNWNFAPVADVNTSADNPAIAARAFGDDPATVARHTAAFVTGLQEQRVAACAKHFPGHGGTTVDSHLDLPVDGEGRDYWQTVALPAFRAAIAAGTASVMTAHLVVPAYDEAPATLSRTLITDVLRGELTYDGVVVSDSLEMRAVYDHYGIVEAGVRAIAAGVDALCLGARNGESRTERLREALVQAVRQGRLPEERLAEAAGRVRRLAAWARPVDGLAPDREIGLAAARRALRIHGAVRLSGPPLVLEFEPAITDAIGETGWGLSAILRDRLPGTQAVKITPDGPVPAPGYGHPVVVVVRDAHRHPWMAAAMGDLLAAHPDAVVVEMGVPHHRPAARGYLATHGASRACALAAVEVLLGTIGGNSS